MIVENMPYILIDKQQKLGGNENSTRTFLIRSNK